MNVRFIKRITEDVRRERIIIGDFVYFVLRNGNRAKAYCDEFGVRIEVINKKEGKVDSTYLPFKNYFMPTQCSAGAPMWYQHIDKNRWYFEEMYSHVLPKASDYKNLASAIDSYIGMFE